jgi:hypothetical protein
LQPSLRSSQTLPDLWGTALEESITSSKKHMSFSRYRLPSPKPSGTGGKPEEESNTRPPFWDFTDEKTEVQRLPSVSNL